FTAVIVSATVATLEPSAPSLAVYVKLSAPLKFAAGVYVNDPLVFSASVPWLGPATSAAVSVALSTSVSSPSTPGAPIISAVSSAVVLPPHAALPTSFTAVIVSATVATLELSAPSLAV